MAHEKGSPAWHHAKATHHTAKAEGHKAARIELKEQAVKHGQFLASHGHPEDSKLHSLRRAHDAHHKNQLKHEAAAKGHMEMFHAGSKNSGA